MKKNSIPQFIGVIVSFTVIWLINDVFLVGACVDKSGVFNYQTGECLLENGDVQLSNFGHYLIAFYFFMAIIVALLVSLGIRKVFKIAP
jgi:hypothetical protein